MYGFPESEEGLDEAVNDQTFVICMGMKTLRLMHAYTIADTLSRFMNILGNIFFLYSYMFENLYKWLISGLKFIISIHYFACIWIYIHERKRLKGWNYIKLSGDDDNNPGELYVNSFYLMVTTISSVGYGHDNFKAYPENSDHWLIEMSFMIFVIIFGMNLFSLVTNEIFVYKSMKTVNQIVMEKVKDMELYLYSISGVRKNKGLDVEMIKHTLHHLEESITSSTRYYFVQNDFYKNLTPNLKMKLVSKVLE